MTRQDHADAVVANLRAGKIDAREVILPPPPPVDADDLAPWMRDVVDPASPETPAPKSFDESVAELRRIVTDLHGRAQRAELAIADERTARETAERALYAARHLGAEAQRARVAQSLQLADALAEVQRLRSVIAVAQLVVHEQSPRCERCDRVALWVEPAGLEGWYCDEHRAEMANELLIAPRLRTVMDEQVTP